MAEAPSSRTTAENETIINTVAASLASSKASAKSPDTAVDLLLYDYVKLRKVKTGTQKVKQTTTDKQLQTWRKGWVVISTKGLVNCTLEYYKDEDQWLTPSKSTKKITICELLKDVKSIKCTSSSYKCHIMSIVYDNYSILIGFKSRTIMQSWITNLDDMRDYFLVQLITSSNDAFKPAPYLLHIQPKKLVGYNAMENHEVAWIWNSIDFYAYRFQRKDVPQVEIVIGTGSAAHGNFHFIGPALTTMCYSIKEKLLSVSSDSDQVDGLLEDSCRHASITSDITDHQVNTGQRSNLLEMNPSYGVLPRLDEKAEQIATTSKEANEYFNCPTTVAEEYECIDVSPSPKEKSKVAKKQSQTFNNTEMSNDYENITYS